jgi:hypothetical protein
MSDSHVSAEALVLAWTSLYTLGLPAPVKRARIDEISSDLWEHSREAGASGQGGIGITLQVLTRLVLGVPLDVAWRIETGAALRAGKEPKMSDHPWTIRRVFSVLVALTVLPVPVSWLRAASSHLIPTCPESPLTIAMLTIGANLCVLPIGIGLLTMFWETPSFPLEGLANGGAQVAAGIAAMAGLFVARASLASGLLLILVSTVAMALLAAWALPAVVVWGVAVCNMAMVRSSASPPMEIA